MQSQLCRQDVLYQPHIVNCLATSHTRASQGSRVLQEDLADPTTRRIQVTKLIITSQLKMLNGRIDIWSTLGKNVGVLHQRASDEEIMTRKGSLLNLRLQVQHSEGQQLTFTDGQEFTWIISSLYWHRFVTSGREVGFANLHL